MDSFRIVPLLKVAAMPAGFYSPFLIDTGDNQPSPICMRKPFPFTATQTAYSSYGTRLLQLRDNNKQA